jgi:CheY-like chemotaxis protein
MMTSIKPAAIHKGLVLKWDINENVPDEIGADAHRLRQIILNLLNNAIKFTKTGSIHLNVQIAPQATLSRPTNNEEVALLFSVQDTGIGVVPDKRAIIFEKFQQADPSHAILYGGTGLGLAIAWDLVTQMSGKIWVEGNPGPGSTFFFSAIFAHSAKIFHSPKDSVEILPGNRSSLKVLIVEDDPNSRELLKIHLEQREDIVITANDGENALDILSIEQFDVILMDIRMPRVNGMMAMQTIRNRELTSQRHSIIIAITAHALEGDRETFIAACMDAYISKPISKKKLFEVIDSTVSKHVAIP